jgi:tryptophanyl-tRNA synthetase
MGNERKGQRDKKEKNKGINFHVTPWEVSGVVDYNRLIKEFGLKTMPKLPDVFDKNLLFRRRIIFAHRNFEKILGAIKNRQKFVMMTGLMPSGKFHLGHMILAQQFVFYQKLGAKLYIAVADLEAYNARQKSLADLRKTAINEYLLNYIALGLKPENCEFYFQSERSTDAEKSNAYYRLASNFSKYATFNEFRAVYGEISPGKMNASLLQAADMYHCQLPEFEGKPLPVFIPVGIDQDPHIRIARDMANRYKDYKFLPISSTYHFFLPSLKGEGKMSSSDENSFIAMTDSPDEVEKKIKKYAFSGGRADIKEHRKKGGIPERDISYQYLRMFFEPDDEKLRSIYNDYKSGKMLTSELKEILIEKINGFLKEHQRKRKLAEKQAEKFLGK